jgi:hypothetical protein
MAAPKEQLRRELNWQIENSWRGKWFRRRAFYIRYYRARRSWSTLRRLEPILKEHFKIQEKNDKNDWIAGVIVRLRAWPGKEDREFLISWPGNRFLLRLRLFPWREQGCF